MRTLGIATLLVVHLTLGTVRADTRAACVAACETTAQSCLATAHEKYDGCLPAARKSCAGKPPSELFACMADAMKSCSEAHSAETGPCRTEFESCYAACGPRPASQVDFWCELDADAPPGSDAKLRKQGLCSSTAGERAADAHARCMKLFTPTDPAIGFSLDCSPLR